MWGMAEFLFVLLYTAKLEDVECKQEYVSKIISGILLTVLLRCFSNNKLLDENLVLKKEAPQSLQL